MCVNLPVARGSSSSVPVEFDLLSMTSVAAVLGWQRGALATRWQSLGFGLFLQMCILVSRLRAQDMPTFSACAPLRTWVLPLIHLPVLRSEEAPKNLCSTMSPNLVHRASKINMAACIRRTNYSWVKHQNHQNNHNLSFVQV